MENLQLQQNEVLLTFNKEEKKEFAKQRALERLGETIIQNCGEIAFIVEYNSFDNITIQFKTSKELVKCKYKEFKEGLVKSNFSATVFGIGITGLENTRGNNGKLLESYQCWKNILYRCYSIKGLEKNPTYKDCIICDEWKYYSNFKKWYNNNYYEVDDEKMHIDKDILHKGNKIYSPETCVFVPQRINKLFIKSNKTRGKYPVGVYFNKTKNKYEAQCRNNEGKSVKLGVFNSIEETFDAYKNYKENLIREITIKYKNKIPNKLYEAMLNWKVKITD